MAKTRRVWRDLVTSQLCKIGSLSRLNVIAASEKGRGGGKARQKRGKPSGKTPENESGTSRDVPRRVREGPSEQLLELPLPSPRRLAVEQRDREGARGARRSARHSVDCKRVRTAEQGPASGSRAARGQGGRTGLAPFFSTAAIIAAVFAWRALTIFCHLEHSGGQNVCA